MILSVQSAKGGPGKPPRPVGVGGGGVINIDGWEWRDKGGGGGGGGVKPTVHIKELRCGNRRAEEGVNQSQVAVSFQALSSEERRHFLR